MKPDSLLHKLSEIPLFEHVEYREVLMRMFDTVKKSMNGGSWLDLAETLGFSRTNAIWLVATRRRKLTDLTSVRIADALQWQGPKRRYWTLMVQTNNTRDPAKRDALMAKLMDVQKSSLNEPDALAMEYFSEWYHPIIRELSKIRPLTTDPANCSKELLPRIMPSEYAASIDLLSRLGLVQVDKKLGSVTYTGENILPSRRVTHHASIKFHNLMMDRAKEALVASTKDRREFNGVTLSLNSESVEAARQILRQACEKIMALETDEQLEKRHLYQVNIHLFPFTKK